jgi:hypothetical protein
MYGLQRWSLRPADSNHANGVTRMKAAMHFAVLAAVFCAGAAKAQAPTGFGTQEFGLSPRELVQAIESAEQLISQCMREQGFEYIAANYDTVHAGMAADKTLPGIDEQEFVNRYGFGVSTFYTGKPPQLSTDYSPAKVGLGERNVEIFRSLSPAEQAAYNHALLGDTLNPTLAVAVEIQDLAQTGGCTRKAVEQVFKPDQLKADYYNPQDAFINKDPRMKTALRYYQREMKKAGFDYSHPDQIEPDLRARLNALTDGGRIPLEKMSEEKRTALKKLQTYEVAVARKSFQLQEEVLTPVEERIQQELFARKVQ